MLHRSRKRHALLRAALLAVLLVVFVTPAAAQAQPSPGPQISPVVQVGISVALTAAICFALITFAYDYTDRTTQMILEKPFSTLVVGIAITIAIVVVAFILGVVAFLLGPLGLILFFIFAILLIPLAIILAVVSQLGYIAVGRAVSSNWAVAFIVAVLVSAVAGFIPIAGPIAAFLITSMGIGAAYLDRKSSSSDRGYSGEQRGRRQRDYR